MSKRSKKKRKTPLSIVIILIILLLGAFGYYQYQEYIEKNKLKVNIKDNIVLEINSEVYLKDLIKDIINGEILNGDNKVNTKEIGEFIEILKVLDKKEKEQEISIKIKVTDTEKPTIEAKKELTTYVGNNINLLDGVKVTDNSGEEIKPIVIGDYDTKKAGKYELKYEAKDSSGNTNEYDFILNVVTDPNNRMFTTSKGYSGKVVNGITYIDGTLIANKSYSLPNSYAPGLTSATKEAFNKMKNDASNLGYKLYIGSGYRSYNDQKYLYNKYVKRDGQASADTYSARAGHSEHQTGLAIDICDSSVSSCINSGFDNTNQAKWMSDNCYKYGFILRYPKGKTNQTGYMYESWHLRYVGVELATKLYNGGNWITLEEYYGIDSKYK